MSTIKEVANRANVSVTTVSRVINNNGYVHKNTKDLINKVIEELNYAPASQQNTNLKGNNNVIGLLINKANSTNSSKLIEMIEKVCNTKGYRIILGLTRDDVNLEKFYLRLFEKYNVQGIIAISKINNLNNFISLKKPMVTINFKITNIPSIITNDLLGTQLAAKEFIDNDCKNILVFKNTLDVESKYKGLIDTINQTDRNIKIIDLESNINKEIIGEHLNNNKFDAIYTTSDYIAMPIISALHQLKINIPHDCCIIGYDNSPSSTLINPSLTSIDYPIEKIAQESCNSIFDIIENNITKEDTIINLELIKRDTSNKNA